MIEADTCNDISKLDRIHMTILLQTWYGLI